MRGCDGSRVADSSANWRCTWTRWSMSRAISSDFSTSGVASMSPLSASIFLIRRARASASDFCALARMSWLLSSESCCALSVTLLLPANRPSLDSELLGGAFRLGHLGAQHVDLGAEPGRGVLGLLELRLALPVDVDVGEFVGDLGGETGIARSVVHGDHARLGELEHREVLGEGVGGLFLLRACRSLGEPHAIEEARQRVGAGVLGEFGIVGEVERLDHLVPRGRAR